MKRILLLCLLILLLAGTAGAVNPEQLTTNTFRITYDKWTDVVIGGKDAGYFKPVATINRWTDECWMKIEYPTELTTNATMELDGGRFNKIKWSNPDEIEIQYYSKENYDGGGFEIEIVLKKRPKTNKISFDIEGNGLRFYYQPALTPEEIAGGYHRPDSVIGSYAVYHATKGKMHKSNTGDAEKYKCGKAFHIYRPKVTDAMGKWVWADLNITDDKMTITIEQDWLDRAVYPVSIDPTFGRTDKGGTSSGFIADIVGTISTGASGTVDSITAYIEIDGVGADDDHKFGIYRLGDSVLVGSTIAKTSASAEGWWGLEADGTIDISAVDYVLVAWTQSTFVANIWNDTRVDLISRKDDCSWGDGTWPDPAEWSLWWKYEYSIYCTYTTDGEPPASKVFLIGARDEENYHNPRLGIPSRAWE